MKYVGPLSLRQYEKWEDAPDAGALYRKAGKYKESIRPMEEAQEILSNFTFKLYLGASYIGAGKSDKAVNILEETMSVRDDNSP